MVLEVGLWEISSRWKIWRSFWETPKGLLAPSATSGQSEKEAICEPGRCQFSSFSQSHLTLMHTDGLQHAGLPCTSPTPRACSNSCPSSQWCHPTISSSVVPFSSCPQSIPASGFFQMSQFFPSGSQIIGTSASASVLPMNIQDLFPLGWTGWISLQSKGLSRVFSQHHS